MSDTPNMTDGWHVRRPDGSLPGSEGGPYAWSQLASFASQGLVAPEDLVWHESMPAWAPASTVQGLFAMAAPAPEPVETVVHAQPAPPVQQPVTRPQPAVQPQYEQPAAQQPQPSAPTPKPRGSKLVAIIAGFVVTLALIG